MNKLAQNFANTLGTISPPPAIGQLNQGDPSGEVGLNAYLSTLAGLFFTFSAVVCAFMIFWAAFDYITSYGEKDGIAKAKQKLTWAIFGIILLSLSFVIFRILEFVTGITFIK